MNQIIMILLISILVLVHEFGHFIAARLCNVRVTRFGIGMPIGPTKKLFKWKNTTFYIHAFLFGGYVAFADDEKEDAKDVNKDEILPSNSPELYENKTILQKFIIVSAGVFMNIIFGLLLVIFAASIYHKLPLGTQNIYIDNFLEKTSSNFKEYNPQKNDKFYEINGNKIDTLYALTFYVNNSKMNDDYANKHLIKENKNKLLKLNPNLKNEIKKGQKIIIPEIQAERPLKVNEKTLKGLEKYKKDGIKLTKEQINLRDELQGKTNAIVPVDTTIDDIAIALSDTYKPLKITVLRNGEKITFKDVKIYKEGYLGVILKTEDIFVETKTPKSIFINSVKYCYTTTKTMLEGLFGLVIGKVSASDMHGVIAVVKIGGDIIATKGMLNGILLTAMISINLAIVNFLPIPALDGGHVMFLLIEKITGKKPTREFAEKLNNFFFMLLIILMVAICYNDIFALVTKRF